MNNAIMSPADEAYQIAFRLQIEARQLQQDPKASVEATLDLLRQAMIAVQMLAQAQQRANG